MIDEMLDLDIYECIMETTIIMNKVEKDFIEFEK